MDFRILTNDPSYERIQKQRDARGSHFIANVLLVVGVALVFVHLLAGLLVVVGLIMKLRANYITTKYRE